MIRIYIELRKGFEHVREHENVKTSLKQVAQMLHCTLRNANLTLKKLSKRKWIIWEPGKGRGNLSTLCFLFSVEEIRSCEARNLVRNGKFDEGFKFVEEHLASSLYRHEFYKWLYDQFGLSYQRDKKDVLRLPITFNIETLDPILTACGIETHLIRQLFDTLVQFDPATQQIEPHLAHSWRVEDDCKRWVFFLRKGVLFYHGEELTSEDVVFSLQRLRDGSTDTPFAWMLDKLQDVKELGKWKVEVLFSESNPFFLNYLSAHPCSIVSKKLQHNGWFVGSGPYKLVENSQTLLSLEANQFYFKGRPYLDRIEIWKLIHTHPGQDLNMRPDQFQLRILNRTNEHQPATRHTICKIENGCKLITFNLNTPGPHQNYYFRKAIKTILANARESELDHTLFVPTDFVGVYNCDATMNNNDTVDFISVSDLLQQSGYSGEVVTLYCSEFHQIDAFAIQKLFCQHNIQVEVRIEKPSHRQPYSLDRNAQIILYESIFDDDLVFSILESYKSPHSYIHRNLNEDRLQFVKDNITNVLKESNYLTQLNMLKALEIHLLKDICMIPFYRRRHVVDYDSTLKGVAIGALGWVDFKNLWIEPED